MGCYQTRDKKPHQGGENEPSALGYGLKYSIDFLLGTAVIVGAYILINYLACDKREEPALIDSTPVESLEDIGNDVVSEVNTD